MSKIDLKQWRYYVFEVIGAIAVSLTPFLPLLKSYFAHDEWSVFFVYFSLARKPFLEAIKWYFTPRPGQFVPLNEGIAYTIFHFFGLNYNAFFVPGILLHGLAGILLSVFLYKLTQKRHFSILGGVLFTIAPNHFQATSWVIANIGYSLSAVLLLIGLIFFFDWIKGSKLVNGVLSTVFLFTSLFAKEITLYIFFVLPIISFIWTGSRKKFLKSLLIVFPGALFIFWHFWFVKTYPLYDLSVSTPPSLVGIVSLPARAISESILPQHFIYSLSKVILVLFPPYTSARLQTTWFNQKVETLGSGIVVILLSVGIVVLGIYLFQKYYHTHNKNLFILYITGILLTAFSSIPYVFVDTKEFTLLQPRYVYTGVLTMTISFVPIAYLGFKRSRKVFSVLIVTVILFFSLYTLNMSKQIADINIERKSILVKVGESLKEGSKNTVIYTKSDTSFYGVKDEVKILPFQAGAGKVLAAYLYSHNNVYIPYKIYERETFGTLDSQGFYSDESGSFGYFRDLDDLNQAKKKFDIKEEDIYAFEYNRKDKSFSRITLPF